MKWVASRSTSRVVLRRGLAIPADPPPPQPDTGYKRNTIGFAR